MNRDDSKADNRLITVGEIAVIAHVGVSAVSNWRTRYPDFPAPAEELAAGPRFRLADVKQWFDRRGRPYALSESPLFERFAVSIADAFRSEPQPDMYLDLVLQLLYLRYRTSDAASVLVRAQQSADARTAVDVALRSVKTENDSVKEALQPSYSLDRISQETLIALIDRIQDAALPTEAVGDVATEIINVTSERAGKASGEFYTPPSLVELMIGILEPVTGTIYDPATGAGMLLAEAFRRKVASARLFGQEVNATSWRIGALHLGLLGADFEVSLGDTLRDDRHADLLADRIVLDPPLGQDTTWLEFMATDPRWEHGLPAHRSGDFVWALHLIWHLAPLGIGVMTCSPAVLFRDRDSLLRARLIREDLIDAVIQLPSGTRPTTGVPTVLVLFSRDRNNRIGQVLFVDAQQMGNRVRGGLHELSPSDVARILDTLTAWRRGSLVAEHGFSAVASANQLENAQWNLSPSRHVGYVTELEEINGELIPKRAERLAHELAEFRPALENAINGLPQWSIVGTDSRPWPTARLGSILDGEPVTGMRRVDDGEGVGLPYVSIGAVSSGEPRLLVPPQDRTFGEAKGRLVKDGDLLLVSRGSDRQKPACSTVRFQVAAAFAESLVRLRIDPEFALSDYVRLYLTSRQGRSALAAAASGTTITNLNKRALMDVEIPLPSLDEQQAIVESALPVEQALQAGNQALDLIRDLHDSVREGLVGGLIEQNSGGQKSLQGQASPRRRKPTQRRGQ